MTDLKIIMRIARTDLAILFYSPIAWFILIVFSFLTTASFTSLMENIVTDYDLSGGKEASLSGTHQSRNGIGFNQTGIFIPSHQWSDRIR